MSAPTSAHKFLLVDDHEAVLGGTVQALAKAYPDADIQTATTTQSTLKQLALCLPNLLVTDLHLPETSETDTSIDYGLKLLREVLTLYPSLNIVVQSSRVRSLTLLRPTIESHLAGFTIVDKSLPLQELLDKADWSLRGVLYIPMDMRTSGLEVRAEWLKVLKLAFIDSLQDKTIAEKMNVSERTVRHYWTRVQDALQVYPEPGKNIRIQTERRAREEGLID